MLFSLCRSLWDLHGWWDSWLDTYHWNVRLYDLCEYLLSSFPFLPMEEYTSLGRWQKLRILLHFSVSVVAEQRADGAMSTENLEQKKKKIIQICFWERFYITSDSGKWCPQRGSRKRSVWSSAYLWIQQRKAKKVRWVSPRTEGLDRNSVGVGSEVHSGSTMPISIEHEDQQAVCGSRKNIQYRWKHFLKV